jgi:hypothetical protein
MKSMKSPREKERSPQFISDMFETRQSQDLQVTKPIDTITEKSTPLFMPKIHRIL